MNRLRELRKNKKITAEKMAEILEISTRHLYDLEAGKIQLAETRIKFLCNEFNITPNYLLGYDEIIEDDRIPGRVYVKLAEWDNEGITFEDIEQIVENQRILSKRIESRKKTNKG